MRPAARRHLRPAAPSSGFTLIEVLVIVVIIATVSAVVLLSLGILGDDRSLQQQARRVSSLIELASDEALMQGRDFGIEFTRSGYRFLEFDPFTDRWHEIVGDDLLRPRSLDDPLELTLDIEDREVALGEEFAAAAADETDDDAGGNSDEGNGGENGTAQPSQAPVLADDFSPHVLIMSSGDISPFVLHIVRPDDRSEIVVDMSPAGQMDIRTAAETGAAP